jgi:hypothetical protein
MLCNNAFLYLPCNAVIRYLSLLFVFLGPDSVQLVGHTSRMKLMSVIIDVSSSVLVYCIHYFQDDTDQFHY